jgi:hypothetical protein
LGRETPRIGSVPLADLAAAKPVIRRVLAGLVLLE